MDKDAVQILDNLVAKLDGMLNKTRREAESKRIASEAIMECRDEVSFAVDKIKNLTTGST